MKLEGVELWWGGAERQSLGKKSDFCWGELNLREVHHGVGISANSGGGAGGVHGFSPFPLFSACVLRTCSEEVIEFPLFTFLEFRPHTNSRVYDSSLGFGEV